MTTHDIAKVERIEMYLKSVLTLAQAGHRVTTSRVAEAMGVVIMLNGGPGTVWGPRALAAYREFAAPEDE